MKTVVHRVALYGFLGSGNLGNDASFETVLSWLRASHPQVALRCITIAPDEVEARYGIASMSLAWRSQNREGGRARTAIRNLLGRLVDIPRSYVMTGSVDGVIVPGMGVLEDTLGVRPWGLPFWLFVMSAVCRLRNRPFLLVAVGADSATNPVTGWLYRTSVRLATHVSYRDDSSAAAMVQAGASRPAAVAPDLAFAHPASTQAHPEAGRIVVGVMAYYGLRDDRGEGAELYRRYVETMADALAGLVRSGSRLVLVGGDRADVAAARDIRDAVIRSNPGLAEDALAIRQPTTFFELTQEMSSAELVIASRFHNLICALRLARPTVSVGYAGKSRDLMDDLGLGDYCQDIEQLDADRLVNQLKSARENGPLLTERIRHCTSSYAAQIGSLLQTVSTEVLGLEEGDQRGGPAETEVRLCQSE